MTSLLFDRDGFGFRFRYPDTLVLTENLTFSRSSGSGRATRHVALARDGTSMVIVSRRELSLDSAAVPFERLREQMDAAVTGLATGVPPGTPTTVGGLPGLTYEFDLDDRSLHSWYLVLFDRALQYVINFQYDDAGRPEIGSARDMILETFQQRPL